MKKESLNPDYEAYVIEQACIGQMKAHIDEHWSSLIHMGGAADAQLNNKVL